MTSKDTIKSNLTALDVAKIYGLKLSRNNLTNCFLHEDKTPSLGFKGNGYKCFSCGTSGDVFSFIQKYKNCSFPEAFEEAERLSGYSTDFFTKAKVTEVTNKKTFQNYSFKSNEVNLMIYQDFYSLLDLPINIREYLQKSRSLSAETITMAEIKGIESTDQAGYIKTQLLKNYSLYDLKQSGLFTDNGFIFYQTAVIFPFIEDGKPVYFLSRNLSGSAKAYKLADIPERYYFWNIKQPETFIFEGIIDALSYYQFTGKDNFLAVNHIIDQKVINWVKETNPFTEIVCVFDNDEPGRKSSEKITTPDLYNFDWNIFTKQTGIEGKDFNDILVKTDFQKATTTDDKRASSVLSYPDESCLMLRLFSAIDDKQQLTDETLSYLKQIYPEYEKVLQYSDENLKELSEILAQRYELAIKKGGYNEL